MVNTQSLHPAFQQSKYLFRRKVFKIFGGAFHIYDERGNVLFYSQQKAFKIREDFRVYSDENQTQELLAIKTPQIFDISAVYNVQDATTGEAVGALRRKGIHSILKDEWIFLSPDGREIGTLTEESMLSALLSRFVNLVPQRYVISSMDGNKVAEIKQHFNPFVLKYTMTITEPNPSIDRRLIISSGILLAGIEGRQR